MQWRYKVASIALDDRLEDPKVGHTPSGRSARKDWYLLFLYNDLIDYFIVCFEHQCVIQSVHFKKQLNNNMIVNEIKVVLWRTFVSTLSATLLRNLRCNRACRFIGKSAVIKCHQLLSNVTSISRKLLFDQLATVTKGPSFIVTCPLNNNTPLLMLHVHLLKSIIVKIEKCSISNFNIIFFLTRSPIR